MPGSRKIDRTCLLALALVLGHAPVADAQSFFTNLGTDPATGVDRGSASIVRAVDARTAYLTFSSYGAAEIGPYITSGTLSWPDLVQREDQLDLVLVLGGLSETDGLELVATGVGYRQELPGTGITLYLNADRGDYALGSASSLALDINGSITNAALGTRKVKVFPDYSRLTTSVELALRDERSEILGAPYSQERLRMLRAALRFERGIPFSFQQRLGLSLTRGFDGFGATPDGSPTGSAPGVSVDFLRAAFSAEVSAPLSPRYLVNAGIVGQWTDDSLPLSQRCGFGTNAYARGFDQSYVNGDRCLGSRIELAYNFILPVPQASALDLRQGFFGLDGGVIEDVANPLQAGNTDQWSSISAGVRVAKDDFVGEVTLTRILDLPSGAFAQDDTRFWFQMALRF